MILNGEEKFKSFYFAKDFTIDTLTPESTLNITEKGRSSDLFRPCGLPTLTAVTIKIARSFKKLTATGIVSDFNRSSLFILEG